MNRLTKSIVIQMKFKRLQIKRTKLVITDFELGTECFKIRVD